MFFKNFTLFRVYFFFFFIVTSQVFAFKIFVSIPPLTQFVNCLVGDWVGELGVLAPAGVCSHHSEWRPSQILALKKADLFVCLKGDPFPPYLFHFFGNRSPQVFEIGQKFLSEQGKNVCTSHLWFSLKNSLHIVRELSKLFQSIFPSHSEDIRKNEQVYCEQLFRIHERIHRAIKSRGLKNIYVGNHSWIHFAKDYNLLPQIVEVDGQKLSLYDLENSSKMFRGESVRVFFNNPHPNNAFLRSFVEKWEGKLIVVDVLSEDFLSTFVKIAECIEQLKVVNM